MLNHNVADTNTGALIGGVGLGPVNERQMRDLNVGGTSSVDAVAQLTALELKAYRHGTLLGLQLDGLASFVHVQERHVVQKGVLAVVHVLALYAVVQSVHVRIIVIVTTVLKHTVHKQNGVIGDGPWIVELGHHAHVGVFVHILGLGRNLLAKGSNRHASLKLVGGNGVLAFDSQVALLAGNAQDNTLLLELVAICGRHGKAEFLVLRHRHATLCVGKGLATHHDGCVLGVHRDVHLGCLLWLFLLHNLFHNGNHFFHRSGLGCGDNVSRLRLGRSRAIPGRLALIRRGLLVGHWLFSWDLLLNGIGLFDGISYNWSLLGNRASVIHARVSNW